MNVRTAKVPELLAPAGGPAEFNAALAAGADAIYCGYGQTFNARRGAQSFDAHTFGEACRRAHLAGARVYVTVNVVIREDELASVLALVRRAWLAGADAFIIQDWGLLAEIHRVWPNIECHVSTQANVHDARGTAWCAERGASRVTLSRELSLPEMAHIARTGVELECFAHGAICFCYSGVCMMSSCAGDRSANRGACAQPCRLPYELVDAQGTALSSPERGRPLCPRDMCVFDDLREMRDAGVASLKLEGRLKGPDYVFAVVGAYREQLGDLALGREPSAEELAARHTRLKRAFNRDFTNAYLRGTSGDELMSYERSNNRGELVGTVVGAQSFGSVKVRRGGTSGGRDRLRTMTVAEVDVALDKPVGKGDLLELRPISDPSQFLTTHAPEDAAAGTQIRCRTTRVVENGSLVRVIRSEQAMKAGARAAELEIPRRRPVVVRIVARLGKPFEVELSTVDGAVSVSVTGFVVEAARTRAVTRDDLVSHVGRMGSTPFEPVSYEVELDEGCGMAFSAVHEVRSHACEALEHALLAPYGVRELVGLSAATYGPGRPGVACADAAVEVCALVADATSAEAALAAGATRVYATADALAREGEAWPQGVVPLLDEVCREADHGRLDAWVRAGESVAVGNVSELALAHERGARAEVRGCIPVHNEACMLALVEAGAVGVWLSAELSLDEMRRFVPSAPVPIGSMVLGRVRAMTSEHCVLQVAKKCVHNCARCSLRRQELFLRSDAGDLFPVRTDENGRSRVYAAHVLDATPQVPDLLEVGVTRFGVDATLLSPEETTRAVRRVGDALRAARSGVRPQERLAGATSGHLLTPVG
ncbi:MAG: U32 family peptidase [Atopobiaceae bacterium]|nr:U32 family peptidase [Atopobiaceae bacterium]